jgi:hypothetical protein
MLVWLFDMTKSSFDIGSYNHKLNLKAFCSGLRNIRCPGMPPIKAGEQFPS